MKILLVIAVVFGTVFAHAGKVNVNIETEVTIGGGKKTIIVDVGNQERSAEQRVRRLERAVRDLQIQVYQLQLNNIQQPIAIAVHTCSLPTSFDGTFLGKGLTEIEARANAVNACKDGGGFPCSDSRVENCATSVQYQ